MKAEHARLKRLQRLERVRAIAKQNAAVEAAQAEGTLAQLEALAERTKTMADEYAARLGGHDAATLQQINRFAQGLKGLSANTANDAAAARRIADVKMQVLSEAERRRAAVEERADRQAKTIAKGTETQALGARRKFGTDLD